MIISHAYKYVFLRTRKTASTSISLYLMQNLFEEGDVTIRDYRPAFEHPAPIMLSDTETHYDMTTLVKSNMVNLDEYKVFAVLRDPYERIISRAFYKGGCENLFDTQRILAKGYVDEDDRDWPQSAYFKYNGQVLADVWHFSEIAEMLPAFIRSYGKEPTHPLRRLKSEFKLSWATPQAIITPAIKQKIDEVFAEDIELYNKFKPKNLL